MTIHEIKPVIFTDIVFSFVVLLNHHLYWNCSKRGKDDNYTDLEFLALILVGCGSVPASVLQRWKIHLGKFFKIFWG